LLSNCRNASESDNHHHVDQPRGRRSSNLDVGLVSSVAIVMNRGGHHNTGSGASPGGGSAYPHQPPYFQHPPNSYIAMSAGGGGGGGGSYPGTENAPGLGGYNQSMEFGTKQYGNFPAGAGGTTGFHQGYFNTQPSPDGGGHYYGGGLGSPGAGRDLNSYNSYGYNNGFGNNGGGGGGPATTSAAFYQDNNNKIVGPPSSSESTTTAAVADFTSDIKIEVKTETSVEASATAVDAPKDSIPDLPAEMMDPELKFQAGGSSNNSGEGDTSDNQLRSLRSPISPDGATVDKGSPNSSSRPGTGPGGLKRSHSPTPLENSDFSPPTTSGSAAGFDLPGPPPGSNPVMNQQGDQATDYLGQMQQMSNHSSEGKLNFFLNS
jgi:hypothetical protein